MSNPYLPKWEYIPDGEPKIFGKRVYIYGSHDRAASDRFCDYKLKVWSAPLDNLNEWVCHGDIFRTRSDEEHDSDVDWSDQELYAPDVVEKDGKYYLFAYIANSAGCVAVSDKPEGPFRLLSRYVFDSKKYPQDALIQNATFIDPGVLVDEDKVYLFCGYLRSFAVELKSNMFEVIDESYVEDIISDGVEENCFFEACSPRKIGNTYYLIYSPKIGSRLDYATSENPLGPYVHRGTIVDNAENYPGGNNHGSVCEINGQWYIFYHRMTNAVTSRRGCVERIEIAEDGSIGRVEMTSLGFQKSLSPYEETKADIACVLIGGAHVTEENLFVRKITGIRKGCIIGFKYYDFGEDYSSQKMDFYANVYGRKPCRVGIYLDDPHKGERIGAVELDGKDGIYSARVKAVTGRHAVYLVVEEGAQPGESESDTLFELLGYMFSK